MTIYLNKMSNIKHIKNYEDNVEGNNVRLNLISKFLSLIPFYIHLQIKIYDHQIII